MAITRQLTFELADPKAPQPLSPDHEEKVIEEVVLLILAVFAAEQGREVDDDERMS